MSFVLDQEVMRKTFSMGENYDKFTHRPAQHIKIFPFPTNNNFTIVTALNAVVGEWLRLVKGQESVCKSLDDTLAKIAELLDAEETKKSVALQIIRAIYWDEHGQIRPNGVDFMCYIPCKDSSEIKVAHYLCSVLGEHAGIKHITNLAVDRAASQANVLERFVLDVLKTDSQQGKELEPYFVLHHAPGKTFAQDLDFILENATRTKEYLVDLLEFYYFFYTSQATLALSRFEHGSRDEIVPLFFRLDWEKTNKARNCYNLGWQYLLPKIKDQFYHVITLEILNQNPSGEQFDYIALREYIETNNAAEAVAEQIEPICELYRQAIKNISSEQACKELDTLTKNDQLGTPYDEIHFLYDSVRSQFRNTDRGRVSDGYTKHFENFCHERFLKFRGTSGLMLTITEEMLIFLTKLVIKNDEQMSLNEVFRQFEMRGVFLDQPSKDEVIRFYTKLNLIEKKSDSGDAQYVKRIL